MWMLIFVLITGGLTEGISDGVPTAILERLKTQPAYMVSTLEVWENGNIRRFATVYVRPYYLLVEFKTDKEGKPYFLNSDIYEVFLLKGEDIITIWTKPPTSPSKRDN
ncbi:MAG: hypothetical protein UT82_C0018G0011 [Parcubacteria group bacterium GW2011_GWB1_40_14]|nr:MAG: hypothetical protein UT82_C0018G0011 [Parcubacteria group bacterium GW2011_GWB1_40_14]